MVTALFMPLKALVKRFKWLMLAMVLVSMLGTSMFIGLTGAAASLQRAFDQYVEDYSYPDGTIYLSDNDSITHEDIQNIEGVDKVAERLVFKSNIEYKSNNLLIGNTFLLTDNEFEDFYFYEQSETIQGLYIEKRFASSNDIHVGSPLKLKTPLGDKTFLVSAIVTSPECYSINRNPESYGFNSNTGLVYVPKDVWGPLVGDIDLYFNQFVFLCKDGYNPDSVMDSVLSIIPSSNLSTHYTYEESPYKVKVDQNVKPLKALANFVPLCFYLASIFVLCLFLGQIIRQYRKELGILISIGYTPNQIMGIICLLSLMVTLASSILSLGLGTYLCFLSYHLFVDSIFIPISNWAISPLFCLIACGIGIAIGLIAGLVASIPVLHISPKEAMSSSPQKEYKPSKVMKLFPKASPVRKLSLMSVLRAKRRFILSSLGLIASLVLIMTALEFHYSKQTLLSHLFDTRFIYDCQISFDEVPDNDIITEVSSLQGVDKVEAYSSFKGDITFNGKSESINLNGVCDSYELMNIPDSTNSSVIKNIDGFILESHTADNLGVKVGDEVMLNNKPIIVKGLSNQYIFRISYMPIQMSLTYGECTGQILCNISSKEGINNHITDIEGYTGVSFSTDSYNSTVEEFAIYDVGVTLAIIFAVFMGFIIVLNMEQTNLLEQTRNLAVMRVLGFTTSSISVIWYKQLIVQLLISFAVGLPIGGLLSSTIISTLNVPSRCYPMSSSPIPYLITAAIIFVFSTISHFICIGKLSKWSLSEKTKTRT